MLLLSGYLVAWKIAVVVVASAVGVGVVVLVIALHLPKVTKLPTGASLLDGDGDNDNNHDVDGHRNIRGGQDGEGGGDEYWTGVNPAVPPSNATASANTMPAVMAVSRHNRTHEQVNLTATLYHATLQHHTGLPCISNH